MIPLPLQRPAASPPASHGRARSVLKNVLTVALPKGHAEAQEVGLPIRRGNLVLPCGATGRWVP